MATRAAPLERINGRFVAMAVAVALAIALAIVAIPLITTTGTPEAPARTVTLGPNDDYFTRHAPVAPALGPNDDYITRHAGDR